MRTLHRAPHALVLALALVGSITVTHLQGSSSLVGRTVETPLAPLAAGSLAGTNSTNGSASLVGALLSTTTDVWWLNNTNATGVSYAKLDVASVSGVANLALLRIGIDNGTRTDQVLATAGALTQTGGAYVQLPPGSANRLYATLAVASLGAPSQVGLLVTVGDDLDGSATVEMVAQLSVT